MGKRITSVLSGRLALTRELSSVLVVCMCMLFTQSGLGITIPTLDYISRTFGIDDDPGKQSWLSASYSLLVGTLVLPMGAAGDLLGHKKLVVAGFAWFSLWSLIAGLSSYSGSHIFFDVCRGFQGMGPAMILPNGVAILGRLYRAGTTRKYIAFCAFAAMAPNGFMVAATFSGIFVDRTSIGWPLSFYIFAIALALVAVLGLLVLPSEAELLDIHRQHVEQDRRKKEQTTLTEGEKTAVRPHSSPKPAASSDSQTHSEAEHPARTDTPSGSETPRDRSGPGFQEHEEGRPIQPDHVSAMDDSFSEATTKFDWIGAFLGVSSLLLLNVAWNQGGVLGWQSPQTYILLIIGFLLGGAFVASSFYLEQPLVPRDVWTAENALVLGCVSLGWSSFGIWSFYSYRIWQVVRGKSVLLSVAYMSPVSITGIVAAFGTGYLLKGLGPGPVLFISMCAFLIGSSLIGTMPAQQTYWTASFFSSLLTPIGMDSSFPSASIILSDRLPHNRQGQAGSLVNTCINWSIAIGLGIGGTVEHYIVQHLKEHPDGRSPIEITFKGYRSAMYVGIGLATLGVLLSALNWFIIWWESRRDRSESAKEEEKGA
ncbi:hypothetical protein OC846_006485 [Tilletia horrida]|uniref:Major facilitator superfamily (MFS) profile domain-containing protein n=1 Tax=Tilletia horrida TaxID=155126 RepID=A0AAN6GIS1_9BASI|nr:hypothetical protein OC845_006483 [Tilletia horrida]KAK0543246.1 hypothetical protein OC846_006485 [Tilletia horrida]KAK0559752.1 hypothetical protein OC861_006542 [Tilletia horrida]